MCHCVTFVWFLEDVMQCAICFAVYVCSEQYEAFLKFNYDEISRRFGETAASCKYH